MTAIVLALVAGAAGESVGQPQSYLNKITVFVRGSAPSSSGFTDPSKARSDSMKDLKARLGTSRLVRPVGEEKEAVIVLEVLDRETKSERTAFGRLSGGGKQNKSIVTVRMTVADFTTEFTGEAGNKGVMTGYADAAGKVVKQIEDWVNVNREKLVALKQ